MKLKFLLFCFLFCITKQRELKELTQNIYEFICSISELDKMEKVISGQKIYICIHFLPYKVKAVFELTVDKLKLITIRRSYEYLSQSNSDFFVQFKDRFNFSNAQVYQKALFYPYHNMTMFFDHGRLVDMKFHDIAYEACPNSNDIPELIATTEQLPFIEKNDIHQCYVMCSENAAEPTVFEGLDKDSANKQGLCDFRLHISFAGTDANGTKLTTSSKALYNFNDLGLDQRYRSFIDQNINKKKKDATKQIPLDQVNREVAFQISRYHKTNDKEMLYATDDPEKLQGDEKVRYEKAIKQFQELRNGIFDEKFATANEYSESLIEAITHKKNKKNEKINGPKKKLTKEEKNLEIQKRLQQKNTDQGKSDKN